MAETKTEIQDLKEFIGDRFNQLDRKIDQVHSELRKEISEVKSELKLEISELKGELKGDIRELSAKIEATNQRINSVETRLGNVEKSIPEINKEFCYLRNWRQIAFIIIAAIVGWVARNGKL